MLNNYQRNVYLSILNSTMILRSIGKKIKNKKRKLNGFRKNLFEQIDRLISLMDSRSLSEQQILKSIGLLKKKFGISYGQSQKAINVIIKYHFRLYEKNYKSNKSILHCPIDSEVIKELNQPKISLSKIDKRKYDDLQKTIKDFASKNGKSPIDFDDVWDNKSIERNGLS